MAQERSAATAQPSVTNANPHTVVVRLMQRRCARTRRTADIIARVGMHRLGLSADSHYCFMYTLQSGMNELPSVQLPALCNGAYDPKPFANWIVKMGPFKS